MSKVAEIIELSHVLWDTLYIFFLIFIHMKVDLAVVDSHSLGENVQKHLNEAMSQITQVSSKQQVIIHNRQLSSG
jgi:hypothetical protein